MISLEFYRYSPPVAIREPKQYIVNSTIVGFTNSTFEALMAQGTWFYEGVLNRQDFGFTYDDSLFNLKEGGTYWDQTHEL